MIQLSLKRSGSPVIVHLNLPASSSAIAEASSQLDQASGAGKTEIVQIKSVIANLPSYRGVTPYNQKNVKALSWTLDRQTAEWFAHRFGEEGTVYEAQIKKEHIHAYFSGRNESEVIVDPMYLEQITESPEPQFDMQMT